MQNTAKYGRRKKGGGGGNVSSDLIYVEFSYFITLREESLRILDEVFITVSLEKKIYNRNKRTSVLWLSQNFIPYYSNINLSNAIIQH